MVGNEVQQVLSKLFPGLAWLQVYNRGVFKSDFLSGITIAAMLIPQSMGYALVAGLPAEYGLYACIAPPVLYALLGTSNKISMGPVALDSILILTGLSALAEPGSDNYLELAIALTLLVGVIQFAFGLVKFGFIANFLSYPVILGYTCAAAIIIMGSQLENILGVTVDSGNVFSQGFHFIQQVGSWHWLTAGIGVIGLAFMIYPKRIFPGMPSGLILLVIGMVCSGVWNAQAYGIDVIATIPQGLPAPRMPGISMDQLIALIPTAMTVALMGYVGSMSICKAEEKPSDKFNVEPNQELVAMGVANFVGAFCKAFPVSASFSRSAAFREAGALTQVSAVISSTVIVIVMVFLTPVFVSYPLPKVLLATIIIISVTGLFKYKQMKALFKQNRHEFLLMLVTFSVTLLLGVQQGLLAGVVLSIVRVIYNTATPHMTELGSIQGGCLFRNVNRFDDAVIRDDILIFRFDAPLYFANKDYFVKNLYHWIKQRQEGPLTSIIFDAESVNSVDTTAILMLQKIIDNLQQQDIKLYITNVIGPVRDDLHNSPLSEYMCEESMFSTIQNAIDYIDHGISDADRIALQTGQSAKGLNRPPILVERF
ncbi:MAG: SulP family sulfate permease [Pseudohongiellaceae bacterium]|jgi:SulP family sulfate permease